MGISLIDVVDRKFNCSDSIRKAFAVGSTLDQAEMKRLPNRFGFLSILGHVISRAGVILGRQVSHFFSAEEQPVMSDWGSLEVR